MRCSQSRRGRRPSRGLTLVELMVAVAILAIVSLIGWRGLDAITRSRQALGDELAQTRGLQLAFTQMQIDCANAVDATVLGGVSPLLIEADRMTVARRSHRETQPSALQLVTWRWRGGVLTREESPPTRDLNQLNRYWRSTDTVSAIAVRLQGNVNQLSLRIWADDGRGWRSWQQMNADTATAGMQPRPEVPTSAPRLAWRGLEVSLQPAGRTSSLTKVFVLGAL